MAAIEARWGLAADSQLKRPPQTGPRSLERLVRSLAKSWERRADDLHDKTYTDTKLFCVMARDMCVLRSCAEELRDALAKAPNDLISGSPGETSTKT